MREGEIDGSELVATVAAFVNVPVHHVRWYAAWWR
jgi:hypothetical protein